MKFALIRIAKEEFKNKNLIIENLPNNKVKFWYKERGLGPNPFILPKYLELDEKLSEAIGIYCGDGKLTKNDLTHTALSTIDEDIAKFVFEFFRYDLDVNPEFFRLDIIYRKDNPRKLKEKWSRILKMLKRKLHVMYSNRHRNDVLQIQIGGIILRKIFQKLITLSLPAIRREPILRQAFLRGHFAADGGIAIYKDVYRKYISEITFNYNPINEMWLRDYLLECLKLEKVKNIAVREYGTTAYLSISNWGNYLKLWSMKLFDRSERKKNKFLEVVANMKVYVDLKDTFRKNLFNSINLTQNEIAKIIDSWQGNVCKTIQGKHLLNLEQIHSLLKLSKKDWLEVISNTEKIRIGQLTELNKNETFLNFVLEQKKLI